MSCNQINIPQVDNSELPCRDTFSAECVIYPTAIAYLNLPANSTTAEVINALLLSLMDARNRIVILENEINP